MRPFTAVLSGVFITAMIVGAFMAVDVTVLHWYWAESSTEHADSPATLPQGAARSLVAEEICPQAPDFGAALLNSESSYDPLTGRWTVRGALITARFSVSDLTGQVVAEDYGAGNLLTRREDGRC